MTRKSLLIIEDDATFSLMLRTWLEKKGFDVTVSSTLSQSKKILSKLSFDLVLCDLRLPDGEGGGGIGVDAPARSYTAAHYDDTLCRYTIGRAVYEVGSL